MKYLIAGLGNIGSEYANTRHNIGFKVLDYLAGESGIFFSSDRYGDVAQYKFKGRTFILLKPSTYMNLSGKAVSYWMQKEKISADNIFIITDDLALPFGKIRIRGKGSDGGHNGLKNITEILGHMNYPRLRFGIGDDFQKGAQVNYVLSPWNETEEKELPARMKVASDAAVSFGMSGLANTMNEFNNK
jgi:PTH1 family peptidyl-tRNA hydrolase